MASFIVATSMTPTETIVIHIPFPIDSGADTVTANPGPNRSRERPLAERSSRP
jgi:hypothetical protein